MDLELEAGLEDNEDKDEERDPAKNFAKQRGICAPLAVELAGAPLAVELEAGAGVVGRQISFELTDQMSSRILIQTKGLPI